MTAVARLVLVEATATITHDNRGMGVEYAVRAVDMSDQLVEALAAVYRTDPTTQAVVAALLRGMLKQVEAVEATRQPGGPS